ncbi:site-specific integrase [Bifidobacterium vespertilionis]|uniref:site-specific integrase n=1 Tax=Bifidobacterium vespertilionis TaxID=2562524 RepID=UPI001BDD7F30|nr:site-specific integrase [Bifidobacterium vespertilionis]MBT1178610.1 tyrosine-type recombinase/integrase [Bifidobacterium vespertilionis]
MARQSRRKRRSFGSGPEEHIKSGRRYLYYSYVTPEWAFSKWPELKLGARQWHVVTPGNEYEAEAWLARAQRELKAGIWEPEALRKQREKRESITFRQFAVDNVEHRKKTNGDDIKETGKQKYRENLEDYLLPFFGDMPMSSITPRDVQRWFDAFQPKKANADRDSCRADVYKRLHAIMESAATESIDATGATLIPSNPCRLKVSKPKPKHVPVRPTREQLDELIQALPEWVRLVAVIADSAGMRESEVLGLKLKHIDFDNLRIHVDEQIQRVKPKPSSNHYVSVTTTPKTASSKDDIPMTPTLADRIRTWVKANRITDPEAPLFVSPVTGKQLYGQNYRGAFARARRKVPGLETLRPHDLRKDSLSRLMESGGTVTEVMRQGRHTTLAVASKYQVPGDRHFAEVMARMDAYDRGDIASEKPDEATVTGGDADMAALAGVLGGMTLAERLEVLRALPADRRNAVLELLPAGVKTETVTALLKDAP